MRIFSEIWGDQCNIFREQRNTDPPYGGLGLGCWNRLENIGAIFLPNSHRKHSKLNRNKTPKNQFEKSKPHKNEFRYLFKKMPSGGLLIKHFKGQYRYIKINID